MPIIKEWPWGEAADDKGVVVVSAFMQVDTEPATPLWTGYRIEITPGWAVDVMFRGTLYPFTESVTLPIDPVENMVLLSTSYDPDGTESAPAYTAPDIISWAIRRAA